MPVRTHRRRSGSVGRLAAFAKATEVYAESLEDHDLANVYWGKALGLWQAVAILTAEEAQARPLRGSPAACAPRRTEPVRSGLSRAVDR